MLIFLKLCCYGLLSYWASAVIITDIKKATTKDNGLPDNSNGRDLRFVQDLDHFRPTDTRIWYQRYFMNDVFYTKDGPVFLIIGGEEEISSLDIESGTWFNYAKKKRALILYLEHRYYGQSRPFSTLETWNLVYLTREQVLADLAWFIICMKSHYPEGIPSTAKWIAFGESYAGNLAIKLRFRCSHLIYAAVTWDSSVLEAVSYSEFFKSIENEIDKYSGAKDQVKDAFQMIYAAINSNQKPELKNRLKLCSSLDQNNGEKNVDFLIWSLTNLLAIAVVYGNYHGLENEKITMNDIVYGSSNLDAVDRLIAIIDIILKKTDTECIFVDHEKSVKLYQNPYKDAEDKLHFQLKVGFGNRQWLYQRCTELGQFETSDLESQLFGNGITLDFFIRFCQDVFGEKFNLKLLTKGVDFNNLFYNGLDMKVSRVIFVHGERDPWAELSVTETKPDEIFAIVVKNAFHCADLKLDNGDQLFDEAKDKIFKVLENWLQ